MGWKPSRTVGKTRIADVAKLAGASTGTGARTLLRLMLGLTDLVDGDIRLPLNLLERDTTGPAPKPEQSS